MNLRRAILVILGLVATLLIVPGAAAQGEPRDDGVLVRVSGTTTVGANEVADAVFVVDGDAVVDGTVRDTLWVVNGIATVTGRVEGDVLVVDGTLDLKPGATVSDVTLSSFPEMLSTFEAGRRGECGGAG